MATRQIIDQDRRSGEARSLSVESFDDRVRFTGTTGVVAINGYYDLYLTSNGKVGGDRFFDSVPKVVVYKDDGATAGGFPRGHGPMGPGRSYSASPHTGWVVSWDTTNERWYARVTNSTAAARDFVVIAEGF